MTKERASKNYSSPKPVVPTEKAIRRIEEQIEIGRDIRDQQVFSATDMEKAQERRIEWLENNIEMVTRLFNNPSFTQEFRRDISFSVDSAITFGQMERNFKEDMNDQIGKLRSLLKHLELMAADEAEEPVEQRVQEEPISQGQPKEIKPKEVQHREVKSRERAPIERFPSEKLPKKEPSKELPSKEKPQKQERVKEVPDRTKIYEEELVSTIVLNQSQLLESNILLVHGYDETMKKSVLEFVEKLELRASILHERANGGKNIIEKLEEFSDIDFAIFLLTPDDFAIPRDKPREKQTHVSQNVIFEFGYFVGKLGPGKVCALYKERLEIPWAYPGLVCIPMDFRGGWRLLLAKEIKQAGIEIDLNKAI